MWVYLLGALSGVVVFISSVILGVVYLLRAISKSLGTAAPTLSQLETEKYATHALFRHFPHLKQKIAWRALGNFPTPVHTCKMTTPAGERVTFSVKREDLCSPYYGGNKVRTLQHALAICESRFEKEGAHEPVLVLGSGGSNQVVASLVHGSRINLKFASIWMKDEPDFDNTLNMLSTLSLQPAKHYVWGTYTQGLKGLKEVLSALFVKKSVVFMPGGNNPAGVLGQLSGCLELAEQIDRGEVKDVDAIYLPIGSACTISGLILGVALVRGLGLKAFRNPSFSIVGTIVHHALAALQRRIDHHRNAYSAFVPMSIRHTIHHSALLLHSLGGPSLEASAMQILNENVRIVADADVVGLYGTHSVKSLPAAEAYDSTGNVFDAEGKAAPPLWVCGHFVGKALCVLLRDLAKSPESHYLLWQTKSPVQPKGDKDEFKAMEHMPQPVLDWAKEGKAHSMLRPGSFDIKKSADTYRERLTPLRAVAH